MQVYFQAWMMNGSFILEHKSKQNTDEEIYNDVFCQA